MGLLDLVEEDDDVGRLADGLGELPASVVADVSGRRADEAGDGVRLGVLGHVDADEAGLLLVEELVGDGARRLGLARAGRADEEEGAERGVGPGEAGAGAHDRAGDGVDGGVLADDARLEPVCEVEEADAFGLGEAARGDAGPSRDDLGDVVWRDRLADERRGVVDVHRLRPVALLERGLERPQPVLGLDDGAVLEIRRALEVPLAPRDVRLDLEPVELLLERLELVAPRPFRGPLLVERRELLAEVGDLVLDVLEPGLGAVVLLPLQRDGLDLERGDLPLEPVEGLGLGVELDAAARARLVDEVDRLVGEVAALDVAGRELGGGDEGRVEDADAVVGLVPLAEAAQDGDRRLDRGLADLDLLEAPLEGAVALDVLAVLVVRRRADDAELAAREERLEEVPGVHGALRPTRADDRVDLVDEADHARRRGRRDLAQHRLEPLLELPAVLRARDQGAHVQGPQLHAAHPLGDVVLDDARREALGDRRLAHARRPDEYRVVLRAPRQDLDHAPNLVVAPDHGVQLPVARQLRHVQPVLVQRVVALLGRRALDLPPAPHLPRRLPRPRLVQRAVPQHGRDLTLLVQREEQVVLRHERVALRLGALRRPLHQPLRRVRRRRLQRRRTLRRPPLRELPHLTPQDIRVDALHAIAHASPELGLDQRQRHVRRLHQRVAHRLRLLHRPLDYFHRRVCQLRVHPAPQPKHQVQR
mmetsp:Transcript_18459/g.58104  ORF Transcript_18459/g.58104 Transcript_18459/m.58104 type:complete len:705 (-) Transcript_18459:244-2358(-)